MLKIFLKSELPLILFWLILGLFSGFVYSVGLLGVSLDTANLVMDRARSLHISLMLYGFVPLVLSLLPFALFEKDGVLTEKVMLNLRRYFTVWNVFLTFMTASLLFGNLRGLPFYDFPYQLNFILAFSGLFYLLAMVSSLKGYKIKPVWVKVSLLVVVIAPILLVFLMNPQYGQVEHTLIGPHGDNTLGMSFALMPIYYLLIKLCARKVLLPRHSWLGIIPLVGYVVSLLVRNFWHPLSYNEEWFYQYLTLFYLPMFWVWWKDSGLKFKDSPYLYISIWSYVFVDVEGNILFIPWIREIIHRNDMVVGHAHIAMGLAVAFMALTIIHRVLPELFSKRVAILWTGIMILMASLLTVVGLIEANWIQGEVNTLWIARSLMGILMVGLVKWIVFKMLDFKNLKMMDYFHIFGFLSDFIGGLMLLLIGKYGFDLLGMSFVGGYQNVVFAFVMGTGLVHWYGFRYGNQHSMAMISSSIRVVIGSVFLALYTQGSIDILGLYVAIYDGILALGYFLILRDAVVSKVVEVR